SALAQMIFKTTSDQGFFDFAERVLRFGEIEIFCKLLADGRSAARELLIFPIFLNSLLNLVDIEAVMKEELSVFAGKHRAHQIIRDAIDRHPYLPALRLDPIASRLTRPCLDQCGSLGIFRNEFASRRHQKKIDADIDNQGEENEKENPFYRPPPRF